MHNVEQAHEIGIHLITNLVFILVFTRTDDPVTGATINNNPMSIIMPLRSFAFYIPQPQLQPQQEKRRDMRISYFTTTSILPQTFKAVSIVLETLSRSLTSQRVKKLLGFEGGGFCSSVPVLPTWMTRSFLAKAIPETERPRWPVAPNI